AGLHRRRDRADRANRPAARREDGAGGALRPLLPLHGLCEDRRGGRRRVPNLRFTASREPAMKAVGARLHRYDGVADVTGRTVFVDDVRVGKTLWAKALRSTYDHAGIV